MGAAYTAPAHTPRLHGDAESLSVSQRGRTLVRLRLAVDRVLYDETHALCRLERNLRGLTQSLDDVLHGAGSGGGYRERGAGSGGSGSGVEDLGALEVWTHGRNAPCHNTHTYIHTVVTHTQHTLTPTLS